ncbi:MAG: Acetyltransferase Pat [Syntrophorhabdus sp. PtaB.Bin047]|nr:MAG: Acetyltransferase Pat [Syntrophorhabdus sp. PtaB.Bin047]
MAEDLKKLLTPGSVALIGASEREGSVARPILLNLANFFKGEIFPVNPTRETLLGMECFPSAAAIPRPVDLAVVVVGAPLVPDTVEECARAGIRGVVIISTMFTRGGAPDRLLLERLLEVRRRFGIRIIGPGSVGIIRPEIGLNTSFLNVNPRLGNIAFVSQSGELGDATLKWGIEAGIGFSAFVSLGWKVDVDFGDVIDLLGDDLSTRSILLSMESVRDARKFMSSVRGFARSKPIIVLKPGRFPDSAAAAVSALEDPWGDDEVYNAAFKRVGVVRVDEAKDLFNAAQVLDSSYVPAGPSLAILGNVRTVGVLAADLLIELGGTIARLGPDSTDRLVKALDDEWNGKNPIDLGGTADARKYRDAITTCLDDPAVDAVLVIYTPHATTIAEDIATAISAFSRGTRKPVIVSLIGGEEMKKAAAILHEKDIPTYGTPEEAIRTYLQMFTYKKGLELLYETPEDLPIDQAPPKNHLKTLIKRALAGGRDNLTPEESMTFLATYGIPVGPGAGPGHDDDAHGLYLAMDRDRDFGSVIRFGIGGIGRRVFRDCAVGLPPLNQTLARRLMEDSRAYTMLRERAENPALAELERIIINFSNLIVDFPEITGIDIDPLTVSDASIAADHALISLGPAAPSAGKTYPHLVITPYPVRYVMPSRLRDGTEIMLRPVRPEDEPLLFELFGSLSERTETERFFSPIKDWTHQMLTRFCNIDYDREIVIVAELREDQKRAIRGVSSLIVGAGQTSEFAVLIHDDYQGRGLGWKLVDVLIGIGQERGVEEIHGTVLTDNIRMLALLKKLNFRASKRPLGLTEVRLRLR